DDGSSIVGAIARALMSRDQFATLDENSRRREIIRTSLSSHVTRDRLARPKLVVVLASSFDDLQQGERHMARVLIVYGTTDGHTAKVAGRMGQMLTAAGVASTAVVHPKGSFPWPDDYDAVIVAASVHGG